MQQLQQLQKLNQFINNKSIPAVFDHIYYKLNSIENVFVQKIKKQCRFQDFKKQKTKRKIVKSQIKLPFLSSQNNLGISHQMKNMVQDIEKKNNQNKLHITKISKIQGKKKGKKFQHIYQSAKGLTMMQRYHSFEKPQIQQQQYSKGIYSLVNTYKASNVELQYLNSAKPKIIKPKLFKRDIKTIFKHSNQIQPLHNLDDYSSNLFITNHTKTSNNQMIIPQVSEIMESIQPTNHIQQIKSDIQESTICGMNSNTLESDATKSILVLQEKFYIQIINYQIKKDNKQFRMFKLQHLPSWGRIICFLKNIVNFLKKYQLRSATIKTSQILKFDNQNRKLSETELSSCIVNGNEILAKLKKQYRYLNFKQDHNISASLIQRAFKAFLSLKKLKNLDQYKLKKAKRIIPMLKYKVLKSRIQHYYTHKYKAAEKLQNQLKQDWKSYQSAVQIHVPSCSLDQWRRLTTHFMQYMQNQIQRIWISTQKQIILIVPYLNGSILKLYEQLLPFKKSQLHIIIPEYINRFPSYIPLSSILYYSKRSIQQIQRIIKNKKAYIVPGAIQTIKPQVLLSFELKCPIYCSSLSLLQKRNIFSEKKIFEQLKLQTQPFILIEQKQNLKSLTRKFINLVVEYKSISIWLFKINKQFKGRGIAKFSCDQQKQFINFLIDNQRFLNQQLLQQISAKFLNILNRKLQYTFQSLYKNEQFITKLLTEGGIIEAQQYSDRKNYSTYEVSLKIQPNGFKILGTFKSIQMVPYSNHIFFHHQIQNFDYNQITKKLVSELSKEGYFGYISYSMILYQNEQNIQYKMIDIKPYLTSATSSLFLFSGTHSLQNKYLYIPYLYHPNLLNIDSYELIKGVKKSLLKAKNFDLTSLMLGAGNNFSLMVFGKQKSQIIKLAIQILRHILNNGFSKSGERQYPRSDGYTLWQIVDSLRLNI